MSSTPPTCPPLIPASRLHQRFLEPDTELRDALTLAYGEDARIIQRRVQAAITVLTHFLEHFGDLPCALYRAPGRISLNPHADHQGAWVPYGAHARELLSVLAPTDDDRVDLANVDPSFAENLGFSAGEELGRDTAAWDAGWFEYIEAPEVTAEVRRNLDAKGQTQDRRATLNYVKGAALRLRCVHPETRFPGLRMALHGDIPQGGGLSSSSSLVVTTALGLSELAGLTVNRRVLAGRCGEAEWLVGTRGGSGDHSAMLFATRSGLAHLRFHAPFTVRDVRYSRFPAGYQIILANSLTRSEKSAEERLHFNRGIFAYRFAFLALKQAMADLGMPEEVVAGTTCLGDLHTGRLAERDLYHLLLRLPEWISPAELAMQFPATFSAAARGCFGTDDLSRLPAKIPLRGAAVYGLGRVDRGLVMPELLNRGEPDAVREFGRLMTTTHDGDRLFLKGEPYTAGQDRLSDEALTAAVVEADAGQSRPLREEPGFYGASIAELDRMVDTALAIDGVVGAGLMGAGGGGYVEILAREGAFEAVRAALEREYYRPLGLEPALEPWHPTAAAGRLI